MEGGNSVVVGERSQRMREPWSIMLKHGFRENDLCADFVANDAHHLPYQLHILVWRYPWLFEGFESE